MIRLHTLGSTHVAGADDSLPAASVAGVKRLALLVYLALARPRGMHRRDTLAALLWPELDQERARAAVRNTLYVLRRALGPDVVVTRGDDDVGIAPESLWCDAVAFDAALDAGRVSDALALHDGEFLQGFFVAGAPEFEQWVERERARVRERAVRAMWTHAEALEAAGATHDAVTWARRATEAAADDERGVRRLLELLARAGDHAGALAAYARFAQRLRLEYDAAPSAETRALLAALCAGRDDASPTRPAPVPAPTPATGAVAADSSGPEPVRPPPSPAGSWTAGARARPAKRPWPPRRARRALLAAVVLATVAVSGLWAVRARAERHAPGAEGVLAIFPFTVRGGDQFDYLAHGMVDVLGAKLDGPGALRALDPRTLRATLGREDATEDVGRVRDVARRVGADYIVLGSVTEIGGRLQLTGRLYERSGEVRAVAQTAPAEPSRVFDLVDDLARQLLGGLTDGRHRRLTRLAAATTTSLPALKAYLQGEHQLRTGRHSAALESFSAAVAHDTSFALAWFRLGAAGHWVSDADLWSRAAERAARLAGHLPLPARRLIGAEVAARRGDVSEAERLYLAASSAAPDNVDAWFGLGDLLYHSSAIHGRSKAEARPYLERALALDPRHGESRIHLLELATWEGRATEVDSLLRGLDAASDFATKWPLVRAILTDDYAEEAAQTVRLRSLDDGTLTRLVIHAFAAFPQNPAAGMRMVNLLTDPRRDPGRQAYGHGLAAQIEVARGRWGEAQRRLLAMAALEPAAGAEFGAHLALAPLVPTTSEGVAQLRAALASWNATAVRPSRVPSFGVHDSLHPTLRLYLIGRASDALGDTAAARAAADTLGRLDDATVSGATAGLARALLARVERAGGDPDAALRTLGEPWLDARTHRQQLSPFLSHVGDRWLRAELLAETGRAREAISAYGAVADYSVDGFIYLPASHLRRAALHERLGQHAEATDHYARFLALWRECDPELRPLLMDVSRRVETLRAKPRAHRD